MRRAPAVLFAVAGRLCSHLPFFRGRDRAFLLLFRALGLHGQHVVVDTVLTAPVRYKARLDLHSWLQRIAFLAGGYEAGTTSFLRALHERGNRAGYLLDIGANVGLISIPAALLLEGVQGMACPCVVSVEAVPDNAAALRTNIALNQSERLISVVETALGETSGTVEVHIEGNLRQGEGTGTASILAAGSSYDCVRVSLRVSTLDALLQAGDISSSCAVIKIDTDGYDLKVLQGGVQFIEKCRPTIFGEFAAESLRSHGQTIADVLRFAAGIDYLVWQRLPGKAWRFARDVAAEAFVQDLLLVPSERANEHAWCCDRASMF